MKQTITEEQLKAIISESVKKVLNEASFIPTNEWLGNYGPSNHQWLNIALKEAINKDMPIMKWKLCGINFKATKNGEGYNLVVISKMGKETNLGVASYGSELYQRCIKCLKLLRK